MITDLKPYPAYKDSSVPWLGKVPEHWEVMRLKHWLKMNQDVLSEKTDPDYEFAYLDIGSVGVGRLTAKPERIRFATSPSRARRVVKPGDTIVSTVRTYLKAVWHAEEPVSDLIASTGFAVLTPQHETSPKFLSYLAQSDVFTNRVTAESVGIAYPAIAETKLGNLEAVVPSFHEQAAIVRYLDYVDRRVRKYIRAKQKLIKLLEEQKQVIIHRAVTRGLDPNVRLKPSGVEWLGNVPEHWEVNQIRSVAHVVRGSSPRPAGSPQYFHGTGAPWITVGEVTRASGHYVTETATRLTLAGAERSRMIETGTLLLTNSGATLGIPKISQIQGCINDGVAAFLGLRPRISKEFLFHYLTTQTLHLKAWVDLGAQPNLNTQIIGGWPVPIPTIEEQGAIVRHIERETKILSDTAARANFEIDLLNEYRIRLIADVVSGKLDVREAAAHLPEEIDEPEPLYKADVFTDNDEVMEDNFDTTLEEAEA